MIDFFKEVKFIIDNNLLNFYGLFKYNNIINLICLESKVAFIEILKQNPK